MQDRHTDWMKFLARALSVAAVFVLNLGLALGQTDIRYEKTAGEYHSDAKGEKSTILKRKEYRASRPYGRVTAEQGYSPAYLPSGTYRQPTSIEFVDATRALITTKLTGQIYQLTLADRRLDIVHEDQTASWGQAVRLAEGVVAVAEHNRNQIVVFQRDGEDWRIVCQLDAPGFPNSLVWDDLAKELVASGKWSRRLYRWRLRTVNPDLQAFSNWFPREQVDLPISGGHVLILDKHDSIVVADAFGCDYVIVGKDDFQIHHHSQFYGHNVTGLFATPDQEMVFFPHQMLNEFARAVRTDITWGGMLSNNIRWLRTDRLLRETGRDVFRKGKFYPLGSPGNGAGDPSSMTVSSDGRLAITLGGTNRVALGKKDDYYFRQVDVGYRPIDSVYTPDETELLVVNQFSDSIAIVDLSDFSVQHLSLGQLRSPTNQERGEQLFFDSRLSHDGWMSCHSCHSQGHTSGQLNDNFTDHSFGTPKRILSLLGQAETMPYSWGGGIETLEEQVALSIESTMASDNDVQDETVSAIATFIRSLPEPPSVSVARRASGRTDAESMAGADVEHGRELFLALSCNDCHAGKQLTSLDSFDVGLRDERSMTQFNPPSLLALSQRQNSLLHDARAKSIRDVVAKEKHQLPREITEIEQHQLVRFLESL